MLDNEFPTRIVRYLFAPWNVFFFRIMSVSPLINRDSITAYPIFQQQLSLTCLVASVILLSSKQLLKSECVEFSIFGSFS